MLSIISPIKGHDANALPTLGNVNEIITVNAEIVWRTEVCPLG